MSTIDCPHQHPLGRICPGCQRTQRPAPDRGPHLFSCDGEITGRVYRDSDGDAGVINGVRHFLAVEDEETTCGCTLTEAQWEQARADLIASYEPGDDLADMYEAEARREAGF